MAFTYQRRSPDAWRKRKEQKGGGFLSAVKSEYQIYTPPDGSNWIRILPPTWEGADHYGIDVWTHRDIGPDGGTVICLDHLKETFGADLGRCSVCLTRQKADFEGDKDLVKALRPTKRVAVWLLDRKKESEGPKIWVMGWTTDRDISGQAEDPQTREIYELDNPDEGYDIFFDRTNRKGPQGENWPDYSNFKTAKRPSKIEARYLQYVIDHPLPDCLNILTPEEMEGLMAAPPEQGAANSIGPKEEGGDVGVAQDTDISFQQQSGEAAIAEAQQNQREPDLTSRPVQENAPATATNGASPRLVLRPALQPKQATAAATTQPMASSTAPAAANKPLSALQALRANLANKTK